VPTSLRDILQNTMDLVRFDKNFKKIQVAMDVQSSRPVKIDPDQMQQVFLNLLLNARDAMPDGGKLDISMKESEGRVRMVFADTGTGIETGVKDKVFDPFFTTKGPSRGTGLGLSICYSIIKDHGGTIEVESEKDKGTKFIITLPVEE